MAHMHWIAVGLAGLAAAAAVSLAPAQEPAALRLDGPHLYEAHTRATNLTIADLNGDGLLDIAVVSNDEGILRILYGTDPKNRGEERPFREEKLTLDRLVQSMVARDVNGDGRTDLLLAGSPPSLAVMYQTDEGRLQQSQTLDLKAAWLVLGDLTGDDLDDVLLGEGRTMHLLASTARGISLEPAQTFYSVQTPREAPVILDLDGDGKNDIVWQSENREAIVARLQSPEGRFPSEQSFETGFLRSIDAARLPRWRHKVAAVHGKTRNLVMLELADPLDEKGMNLPLPVSGLYSVGLGEETWGTEVSSALADVDGDGRLDLIVANPKAPSLKVLRQTRTGGLSVQDMPAPKGIVRVEAWPAERGKPQPLVMLSTEESTLVVASGSADQSFPQPVRLGAAPLTFTVAGLKKGDAPALLVVEEQDRTYNVVAYERFDPVAGTPGEAHVIHELAGAKEKPASIVALDANQDGRRDLVVFFSYEAPMLVMQQPDGTFEKREAEGGLAGLLRGTTPSRLAPFVSAEHRDEVLLVKDDFARALHLAEDGRTVIRQQYNAPNSRTRFRAARQGAFRGGAALDLALLDSGNRKLMVFGSDGDGAEHRALATIDLDSADYQAIEAFDLDGDNRDDIVLIAPDRVTIIYTRPVHGTLETVADWEVTVEDGGYGLVRSVRLAGGGADSLAAVEMKENMLQLLTVEESSRDGVKLSSLHHFRVFDSESSLAQRVNLDAQPEPRAIRTADLDGNGMRDVVALVHDYVIVYYALRRD